MIKQLKFFSLIVAFIFLSTVIAIYSGITQELSKLFYYQPAGLVAGEYTVRIAQVGGSKSNPSYPRTVVGYPANESHFTGCQDLYSQFNMAKISGDAAFCVQAAESVNPNILKFGTWGGFDDGNFPSNESSFGYHIFRSLDPQLSSDINGTSVDVPLENTDGTGFPRWEDPPGSGTYPYGTVGSSVFIVGPNRQTGVISYSPDRISYGSVDEANYTLEAVGGIGGNHSAHEYIRIPIKIRGWSPNVTAVNPYGGDNAIDYYLDNKYAGNNLTDASHFDGVWYDTQTLLPNNYSFEYTDFDMNWQADETQYGLAGRNTIWYDGVHSLFNEEKSRTGVDYVISNDGYGVIPPDEVISWHNGFVVEKGMKGLYDWQLYFDALRKWDSSDKFVVCIDGSTTWTATKYASYKNRYQEMRLGLAMNTMGPGYYGHAAGPHFFFTYVYDEYKVELGYPLGAPIRIANKCNSTNGRCPYVRFFTNGAVVVNHTLAPVSLTASDLSGLAGYAGPYYRFYGGQNTSFNNGTELTDANPIALDGTNNGGHDGQDNTGDGVILVNSANYYAVADIVVGNFNNNDTSPGSSPVEVTGSWNDHPAVNANNPYYSQWDQDDVSLSSEGAGYFVTSDANARATFRPTIGIGGEYRVYEWHGWDGSSGGDNEATNVPYEVNIGGTVAASGTINQRMNAGQWNLLGTHIFPQGTNSYVRISATGADGPVLADAVKFEFTGNSVTPPPPPPPPVCNNNGTCDAPTETTANCPADCPAAPPSTCQVFDHFENNALSDFTPFHFKGSPQKTIIFPDTTHMSISVPTGSLDNPTSGIITNDTLNTTDWELNVERSGPEDEIILLFIQGDPVDCRNFAIALHPVSWVTGGTGKTSPDGLPALNCSAGSPCPRFLEIYYYGDGTVSSTPNPLSAPNCDNANPIEYVLVSDQNLIDNIRVLKVVKQGNIYTIYNGTTQLAAWTDNQNYNISKVALMNRSLNTLTSDYMSIGPIGVSCTGTSGLTCNCGCYELLPDYNCDCDVNVRDFGIMLSYWLKTSAQNINSYQYPGVADVKDLDLRPDSVVDIFDIGILLGCWGKPGPGQTSCWGGSATGDPVQTINPPTYQIANNINVGSEYYIDRTYTVTSIPGDLAGLTWIKTANDDKFSNGNAFMNFTACEDLTVYVAYDSRISPVPSWLSSWTNTGLQIGVSDLPVNLNVYQSTVPAGAVTLGGNQCPDNTCSMYAVLVKTNP